jgi:hypothetical protein
LGAASRVILVEAQDLKDHDVHAQHLADVHIDFKGSKSMSILAPSKPGQYVLTVLTGFVLSGDTREISVAQ